MRVTQQGALQHLQRAAMLQRQAGGHRSVASVGIALRAGLVVLEEDFPDTAIGKAADGGGVFQAVNLKLEGLGEAAIRQAGARAHGAASTAFGRFLLPSGALDERIGFIGLLAVLAARSVDNGRRAFALRGRWDVAAASYQEQLVLIANPVPSPIRSFTQTS